MAGAFGRYSSEVNGEDCLLKPLIDQECCEWMSNRPQGSFGMDQEFADRIQAEFVYPIAQKH